jgi:methylglutaconyl-CoA hydratase
MEYENLTLAREDGVATLTLNRPEKRNAISYRLIEELLAALDEAAEARVLIVTGAGGAFCSGMDLDELRALTTRSAADNRQDAETMARLFRTLYEFPRPTIAAVNGAAIAGGCGLATLCDFTLASATAKFGYSEARIGFIPALVAAFLVRQVGEKHARELLLSGRVVDAAEAKRLGLVTAVVAPDELMPRARRLAAELLRNSPASLAATKRLLGDYAAAELERELRLAVAANAAIRATEDCREGVAAFLEKRRPRWAPE